MYSREVACWEALDPGDPSLEQARRLYEGTLDAAERIPWLWIEEAVAGRRSWRPGRWSPHLLLAAQRRRQGRAGPVAGFAYGLHVPGYGGYACYLAVAERSRRQGIGSRLLRLLIQVLKVDAGCEGAALPFVVWESRRPEETAGAEEKALWPARLRLFERVGAYWVAGLTFLAPSFKRWSGRPVPLQLFIVPADTPAEQFDAAALREVAGGLLRGVYGRQQQDPLFAGTLPPGCRPELQPVENLLAMESGPHS